MKNRPSPKEICSILRYEPFGSVFMTISGMKKNSFETLYSHNPEEWFRWHAHYQPPEDNSRLRKIAGKEHLELKIGDEYYLAEELAWVIETGAWPEYGVEHIDGQTLNNLWSNLRAKAADSSKRKVA